MVRLRHRYLVTESSVSDGKSSSPEAPLFRSALMLEALNTSIRHLHGIQGVATAKSGLMVKYINNSTNILFIRMRRSAYRIVTSALPFVRQVGSVRVTFRTLYTGATIKSCNQFLVKYQRRKLEEDFGSLKSDLQRQLFERELVNVKPLSIQTGPLQIN